MFPVHKHHNCLGDRLNQSFLLIVAILPKIKNFQFFKFLKSSSSQSLDRFYFLSRNLSDVRIWRLSYVNYDVVRSKSISLSLSLQIEIASYLYHAMNLFIMQIFIWSLSKIRDRHIFSSFFSSFRTCHFWTELCLPAFTIVKRKVLNRMKSLTFVL